MTIDPKDLRRLIIRVVAVTVALRALHLFSVDLGATEIAHAWALPAPGHSAPLLAPLVSAWRLVTGGFAALVRLPSMLADVALPLLAVAYARACGWGTLPGLLAGLMLAVAPFGLDEGWRADGSPWLALLSFAALWQLQLALRTARSRAAMISAGLLAAAVAASPMSLIALPAGLLAVRLAGGRREADAAAGDTARWTAGWGAAALWLAAGALGEVVGSAARAAVAGPGLASGAAWLPGLDQATAWLADARTNGGLPPFAGAVDAALSALAALSPGGATGGVATLAEAPPAPLWRSLAGAALWPVALLGLWRGWVVTDASAQHPAMARRLGWRAGAPLLLPLVVAVVWAAWAGARADAAGVLAAIAVARPFAAMALGLGVTALALTALPSERAAGAVVAPAKRAVTTLVLAALLLFGLGAHHTFAGVQDVRRMAATKVARFVAGNISRGGEVLALGLGGLQIAYRLGPWPDLPRVHRAASAPAPGEPAARAADTLLATVAKERRVVVVGDRWVLESSPSSPSSSPSSSAPALAAADTSLGPALDAALRRRGFSLVEDGHRLLGRFSVRVYGREGDTPAPAPSVVRPQLYPGQQP